MKKTILFFLFFVTLVAGFGQKTMLVKTDSLQAIGQKVFFFDDSDFLLGVDGAFEKYKNGDFTQNKSQVYSSSVKAYPVWLGITLKSVIQESLWLSVNYSQLDSVYFYKLDENGTVVDEKLCGTALGREYSYNSFYPFWFPLLKPNEGEHTFLLKIYSSKLLRAPLQIGSKEVLYIDKNFKDGAFLFFIGGMLFILLYNLSIFFIVHESVYLYYVFYVFFVTLTATLINGFPIVEFIFGSYLASNFSVLIVAPVIIFVDLTTLSFFNLKERSSRFLTVLRIEIGGAIFLMLLSFIVEAIYLVNIVQVLAIFTFLTCVVVSVYFSWKGPISAKVFSMGWGAMFVGAAIQLSIISGFIDLNIIFHEVIIFSILIEVLVFSVALATKIRFLKSELVQLNETLTRSNAELKSSNDAIDSFNYHVSHELKTVLNNSKSLSKMALKYISKDNIPKVKEILMRLDHVADSGADTVKSFLSLGQSNSLLKHEKVQKINLSIRIKEVLKMHNLENQIEVIIEESASDYLFIHEKALDTILLNFLTNTIKYNKNNLPQAKFNLVDEAHFITLIYSDNGVGIDMKKDGEKLFKPFTRISNSLETEGSGVGMYLVQRIVQNYNGSMKVESEVGQGITIHIIFPKLENTEDI